MSHTTFTQSNLSVSSAVVNPLFSSMGKRAGEYFAVSACAKQQPIHCSAMVARKIIDKNADMDFHAVLPPEYQAGGDCSQYVERVTRKTPRALSKIRATGCHKKICKRNSMILQIFSSRRANTIFQPKYWRVYVEDLVNILPIFKLLRSTLRFGANLRATACGLHGG